MLDPDSRYHGIEVAIHRRKDGTEVPYIRRRILPRLNTNDNYVTTKLKLEEINRIDRVSERILGDPLQFWRICDANLELNPVNLTKSEDQELKVMENRL